MALIKCPECGTEVSDKAKICVKCGYPLADTNSNSGTLIAEVTRDESTRSSAAQKTQSKMSTKTLLIIAACIIAVGAIVMLSISMSRPALPYGLNPSMQEAEVNRAMKENGFSHSQTNNNTLFYSSKTIYGVRTDFTAVTYDYENKSEYLSVKHFYNKLNENQYATIKDALVKEYGTPQSKYGGGYKWVKGKVEITFDDISDADPVVQITFSDFH